jgi:5-hydroxyisourate hydrolase
MGISTHILDTTRGRPAADVSVQLERWQAEAWLTVGEGRTNADGRVPALLGPGASPEPGRWRISFAVAAYFEAMGVMAFYPTISIEFLVRAPGEHYHVPLLLNPYGYSTYRGS